jgi:hypothetical protein
MNASSFKNWSVILSLLALGFCGCSITTQSELFKMGSLPVQERDTPYVSKS